MPFDIEQTALRDMRYHIDLATHFVAGVDSTAFCDDLRCACLIALPFTRTAACVADVQNPNFLMLRR
jgi:hypothetical protein